jgi:hypothetical protein
MSTSSLPADPILAPTEPAPRRAPASAPAPSAGPGAAWARAGAVDASALSLDDLLSLDAGRLERLYREASVPDLDLIEGDLPGRMLALVGLPGAIVRAGRALAGRAWFPWRGKSFRALGGGVGEGINRALSDRWPLRWFRFTTLVAPSRAGDFAAVQLDYDHAGNPGFIRAIRDEIRELRPGLYLGQAYLHARGSDRLVLYFALALPGRERA